MYRDDFDDGGDSLVLVVLGLNRLCWPFEKCRGLRESGPGGVWRPDRRPSTQQIQPVPGGTKRTTRDVSAGQGLVMNSQQSPSRSEVGAGAAR